MKAKHALGFSIVTLLVGAASTVSAQSGDCATDADCPADHTCHVESFEVCAPCESGTDCTPECTTRSSSYCVPPPPQPCDSDASCTGGDVCVTYTFESCSGGDAAPIAPCDDQHSCDEPQPTEEPECTTESESYCVPPYFAPCQVDADCGGGFTCEDQEICSCSGGTAPSPRDGDTDAGSPEPVEDCTCAPSGDKYCQLIETVCTTDADCAAGLTCTEMPPGPDVAVACAPDEPCPEPEPAPVEKYCAPEDYYWGAYGSGYDDAVAEASGNENDALTGAERSSAPNPGSDGSDGSGGSAKGDPSTCATGLGTRPAAPALLLFLGLVLGRVRRRR